MVGQNKRLGDHHMLDFTFEILLKIHSVDNNLPSARHQEDSSCRSLPLAGSIVLSFLHR